jgi:hypothetical protein
VWNVDHSTSEKVILFFSLKMIFDVYNKQEDGLHKTLLFFPFVSSFYLLSNYFLHNDFLVPACMEEN